MQTLEYSFVDKSDWSDGPWKTEPDKIQYMDEVTGLPCLIVRARLSGALCGYVGVGPDHMCYSIHYNYLEDLPSHGGITFTGRCQNHEHGVCHIVEASESDDIWWIGYDCSHFMDVSPCFDTLFQSNLFKDSIYRTIDYVKEVNRQLALALYAHPKYQVKNK
jgi:hypothetical protein